MHQQRQIQPKNIKIPLFTKYASHRILNNILLKSLNVCTVQVTRIKPVLKIILITWRRLKQASTARGILLPIHIVRQ